jgi:tetratricopeptide (TPR) repeat protein
MLATNQLLNSRYLLAACLLLWIYTLGLAFAEVDDSQKSFNQRKDYESKLEMDQLLTQMRADVGHGSIYDQSIQWAELGILYQEYDMRWRQGGTVEALECLLNACRLLDSDDRELRFAWTLQIGILLASLDRGEEAVKVFQKAQSILHSMNIMTASASKSDPTRLLAYDEATILLNIGDAYLTSIKDGRQAARYLEESLSLNPCEISAYWKYVQALSDCEDVSEIEWKGAVDMLVRATRVVLDEHGNKAPKCNSIAESTYMMQYVRTFGKKDEQFDGTGMSLFHDGI